jgi:hypothetical protein
MELAAFGTPLDNTMLDHRQFTVLPLYKNSRCIIRSTRTPRMAISNAHLESLFMIVTAAMTI